MKVFWTVRADKPEAARRLAERLMLAGDELATNPYLGRQARGLRELIVGNYLPVYRKRQSNPSVPRRDLVMK